MKKILASAGLVAIGAASLHAGDEYAPDVSALDASRVWSISGTLRGFYDSNYTTSQSPQYSWGFEVSPSISIIVPLQQTELGLRYTYGLYWYQARERQGSNPVDQTQAVSLWIDHAFSERWEAKVQDSFNVSQDPALALTGQFPYRAEGNNINNIGLVSVHTDWSALFSTDLSYQNNYLHYENDNLGAFLNQLDHTGFLNLNYQYLPDLSFLVGYQFALNHYTADAATGTVPNFSGPPGSVNTYFSDNSDNYQNSLYVGGKFNANKNLDASVQLGVTYVNYYNLPSFSSQTDTQWAPYAQMAATYTYLPGSYAQIGFTESVGTSDSPNPSQSNGSITLSQETSVLYGTINHQITPYLTASVVGRWQYGIYQGGASDGDGQSWYSLGVNLNYKINMFLSAEAGYNYDYVANTTALPGYRRSVTYLGITAAY